MNLQPGRSPPSRLPVRVEDLTGLVARLVHGDEPVRPRGMACRGGRRHRRTDQVGHGIVDPVAALTWQVPAGDPVPPEHLSSRLVLPPPPKGRNMTPVWIALAGIGAVAILSATAVGLASILRGRNH